MSIYKIISQCVLSLLIINGIISLIKGTCLKMKVENNKTGLTFEVNITTIFMIIYVSLLIWLIN